MQCHPAHVAAKSLHHVTPKSPQCPCVVTARLSQYKDRGGPVRMRNRPYFVCAKASCYFRLRRAARVAKPRATRPIVAGSGAISNSTRL